MSAILPQLTQGPSPLLGVLAILLLVGLLVERELLRAAAGTSSSKKGKLLDIAIIPLILVFSFVVLEHFYRLIF